MKKLIFIQITIIVSAFAAIAQTADEKTLLKFIADYDRAYETNDIRFVERNLHEDYILVLDGERKNRAELLAEIRQDIAAPQARKRDLQSTNDSLRVVGEVAVAAGLIDWKESEKNNTNAGQERYTLIFERRGGRWLLLSEHISSIRRDRAAMEAEVTKASSDYTEMIRRRDVAAIERVLTDEYVSTNEAGQIRNKAQDLERQKNNPYKIESLAMSDQKVRVYGSNIAVETGKVTFKGADKNGKTTAGSERYTSTWIRRDGRWQIIADHISSIAATESAANANEEAEIRRVLDEYLTAMQQPQPERDRARELLLTGDYFYLGVDGLPADKKFVMERQRRNGLKLNSLKAADVAIRRYGDTAIVTMRSASAGVDKNQSFGGDGAANGYATILIRQNGAWRIAADVVGREIK